MKYIKKPVIIEAVKYDGTNKVEIQDFMNRYLDDTKDKQLKIETLEGVMLANVGDYIIKGINGEFYPCKPDIFKKTYKKAITTTNKKINLDGMKAEIIEEFTVGIDIKKGTKAIIVKREDGKYIVFNKNQKKTREQINKNG